MSRRSDHFQRASTVPQKLSLQQQPQKLAGRDAAIRAEVEAAATRAPPAALETCSTSRCEHRKYPFPRTNHRTSKAECTSTDSAAGRPRCSHLYSTRGPRHGRERVCAGNLQHRSCEQPKRPFLRQTTTVINKSSYRVSFCCSLAAVQVRGRRNLGSLRFRAQSGVTQAERATATAMATSKAAESAMKIAHPCIVTRVCIANSILEVEKSKHIHFRPRMPTVRGERLFRPKGHKTTK